MQSHLSGNACLAVLCCISPNNIEETRSTLKFAASAKRISVAPVQINTVIDPQAMIASLRRELVEAKRQVALLEEAARVRASSATTGHVVDASTSPSKPKAGYDAISLEDSPAVKSPARAIGYPRDINEPTSPLSSGSKASDDDLNPGDSADELEQDSNPVVLKQSLAKGLLSFEDLDETEVDGHSIAEVHVLKNIPLSVSHDSLDQLAEAQKKVQFLMQQLEDSHDLVQSSNRALQGAQDETDDLFQQNLLLETRLLELSAKDEIKKGDLQTLQSQFVFLRLGLGAGIVFYFVGYGELLVVFMIAYLFATYVSSGETEQKKKEE